MQIVTTRMRWHQNRSKQKGVESRMNARFVALISDAKRCSTVKEVGPYVSSRYGFTDDSMDRKAVIAQSVPEQNVPTTSCFLW
jgi:hypothetical protein